MDRLGNIEAFVEAAELGSFTRAARKLRLSPSALSRRIAQLEEEIGVRLLHRTTRAVRLSDEGRSFFERSRSALRELEQARALATRPRERPAGLLRVEVPTILGRCVVVPAVVALTRRHPDVDVDVTMRDYASDLVSDGVDVALRLGPLPDSGLVARRLGQTRMQVCGSPEYLRRHRAPRSVDELASHERLAFAVHGQVIPWRLRDGDTVREVSPSRRIVVSSADALIDLAIAGVGLAWMCDFMMTAAHGGGALVEVLPESACVENPVYAVSLSTRHTLPKVRVFLDFVAAELAKSASGLMRAPLRRPRAGARRPSTPSHDRARS